MCETKKFGIIGGDERQIFLATYLKQKGFDVYLCGFENFKEIPSFLTNWDLEKIFDICQNLILPVPISKRNKEIFSPFAEMPIKSEQIPMNKIIFCADRNKLILMNEKLKTAQIFDLLNREDFLIANALPTAEGAIQIAMQNTKFTINGAKCLVVGYGRIGKVLAPILKALNARTTVSARNIADLECIKALGFKAMLTSQIKNTSGWDIIFNTVPALIFNKEVLEKSAKGAFLIDLASMPGGVDFESAVKLNIVTKHALALPGKVAPKTAGLAIANSILNIIKEEKLWEKS